MLETALSAFATFFATIGPVEAAVVFATFCPRFSRAERIAISLKAIGIATGIILFFAIFGTAILSALLDMIFESKIFSPESAEARAKNDEIAVFPLATAILAGPGAMSGAMLLMAGASGNILRQVAVIAALLTVMAFTLLLLLAAQEIREWVGVTAQKVVMRVFGILLAAIAVQSVFNGIAGSGIFQRSL